MFFCLLTELFIKYFPLARRGRSTFFFAKKKKVPKKKLASLQLDRLAARQLCRSNFFCSRKYRCPVVPILPTPKSKRLEIVVSRKNGFDLTSGFFWEPHHANQITFHLKMKGFRFVGSAVCVEARGCLHRSADIPTLIFSPQEALRR